ncbi:MAG: ABC transporter permease [Caldimonas sp.]
MHRLGVAMGENFYVLLLLVPALLVGIFYLVPVLNVLFLSVSYPRPTLENYQLLFDSSAVQRILLVTARICLVTTAITVACAYLIAYRIVQAPPAEARLLLTAVLIAFWISVLIRAFAWVALLQPNGLINTILMATGVIAQPLALVRNEVGVVIGMVHYMVPYAVLPLLGAMRGIDPSLSAAARSLGANKRQTFAKVFFPLSVPGIATAVILVFILALGFYITPAILGGGKVVMIAEYISLQMTETLRWGVAAMLAVVMLVAVTLLIAVLSRVSDVDSPKVA